MFPIANFPIEKIEYELKKNDYLKVYLLFSEFLANVQYSAEQEPYFRQLKLNFFNLIKLADNY